MRLIKVVQKIKYLVVSCDEITIIDIQSLCNMHAYIVDDFKRMPLLLNFEKLVGKGFVDNLATSILKSRMKYGCLIVEQIGSKLVCFGLDGGCNI
jgi:hypothetical protein